MKTIVEIHLLCKELTQAIKKISNAKGKQAPVSVSRKCNGVHPVGGIEALLIERLLRDAK